MKSFTRSGRVYKTPNEGSKAEKGTRATNRKKNNKANVVTPQKVTIQQQQQPIQNEPQISADQPFAFDYCVELELKTSELDRQLLSADDNTFKYSISNESDNESESNAEVRTQAPTTGSAYYANNLVTPVRLGRIHVSQEHDREETDQQKVVLQWPPVASKTRTDLLLTVPIHPLVPRNQYGGIRDCLPPIQLTRMQSTVTVPVQGTTPTASADPGDSLGRRVLAAEQLLRMENNRLLALARLRAKETNN